MNKLIIDGNKVYEVDEECLKKKKEPKKGEKVQQTMKKNRR